MNLKVVEMKRSNPPLYHQAYIDAGQGPIVILLHGLFGNVSLWKSTIDVLKESHRVIVPRLPIFDLPIQHTNVKYLSTVLHDFIEWHGLTDVVLLGHALGGQVALLYAHEHSNNVQKIILTGSAGLFENSPFAEDASALPTDFDYVHEKVSEAFYQTHAIPGRLVDEIYSAVRNIPKRLTLGSFARSSRQNNVAVLLNKLDHPILLLWGMEDKITPPEVALHFHDFLQNSEIRFIDECGHVPMLEKPDAFNQHVNSFLKN
jgi:2-hydroxy-6-oxonona-2,4-dienedioate hydrolase